MRTYALTLAFLLAFTGSVAAKTPATIEERSLGKADAPVVLDEYASLTCSHCYDFFESILPELQKRYVDQGKLKIVFHDFPMDAVGLKASALAHCMPKEQFFPFLKILYANMRTWALSPKPEAQMLQYAKLGGLSEERGQECLKDDKILDALVEERTEASQKYDIKATPTFIVNKGEDKIVGAQRFDAFAAAIDKALAAKKH